MRAWREEMLWGHTIYVGEVLQLVFHQSPNRTVWVYSLGGSPRPIGPIATWRWRIEDRSLLLTDMKSGLERKWSLQVSRFGYYTTVDHDGSLLRLRLD